MPDLTPVQQGVLESHEGRQRRLLYLRTSSGGWIECLAHHRGWQRTPVPLDNDRDRKLDRLDAQHGHTGIVWGEMLENEKCDD